eukprot:8007076-Pyramimonas_sp.AAC.2
MPETYKPRRGERTHASHISHISIGYTEAHTQVFSFIFFSPKKGERVRGALAAYLPAGRRSGGSSGGWHRRIGASGPAPPPAARAPYPPPPPASVADCMQAKHTPTRGVDSWAAIMCWQEVKAARTWPRASSSEGPRCWRPSSRRAQSPPARARPIPAATLS